MAHHRSGKSHAAAFLACMGLFLVASADASPRWHWEDRFSDSERQNLTDWVRHAHSGLVGLIGDLPYSYDVHFHDAGRSREPVPWAHTWKAWNRRAVNFHVDPRYSQREFERDWTAYHELSHLMFPYLGRSGMWFAEGIASYLQYQAMYAAGELSWAQAMDRYENRFTAATKYRRLDVYSTVELAHAGRVSGRNVRLYWGGAAYFMEVDRRLAAEQGMRLHDVIRDYLDCCFGARGRGVMGMVRTFDRISDSEIFAEVYADTVEQKGFPESQAALDWLADNPPDVSGPRG